MWGRARVSAQYCVDYPGFSVAATTIRDVTRIPYSLVGSGKYGEIDVLSGSFSGFVRTKRSGSLEDQFADGQTERAHRETGDRTDGCVERVGVSVAVDPG